MLALLFFIEFFIRIPDFYRIQSTNVHSSTRMANHLPAKYGLQKENASSSNQLGWHLRHQYSQNVSKLSRNIVCNIHFRNEWTHGLKFQAIALNSYLHTSASPSIAAKNPHFFKMRKFAKKSSWLICTTTYCAQKLLQKQIVQTKVPFVESLEIYI